MISKSKLKFIAISDPISSFDQKAETTSFLLYEAQRRKFEIWQVDIGGIYLDHGEIFFKAKKIRINKSQSKFSYKVILEENVNAVDFDVFLLRKDPPVDIRFIDHLSLLEIVEKNKSKPRVFLNSPSGVKLSNEKIFPFHFKNLSPKTLISSNEEEILKFLDKYGKSVIKPLNLSGGRGIYILNPQDPNLKQIISQSTEEFTQFVMIQKFLPQVKRGDKRILLSDGKILGSFIRVPHQKDFRGNMHQGATWEKTDLSPRDLDLIREIVPTLNEFGLFFVGIDIIGPYITEINTTSPMGIREINALYQTKSEKKVIDQIVKKI